MYKIKLNNEKIIPIEYGASSNQFQFVMTGLTQLPEIIDNLIESNMCRMEILNDAEMVTSVLENKKLAGNNPIILSPVADTGNWKATINMVDVDVLQQRIAALESGQTIQNDAIADMSGVVYA